MTQKSFKHSKILTGAGGAAIAYDRITGNSPGVMFLGGFMSNMRGAKATALEKICRTNGHAFVRFDIAGMVNLLEKFLKERLGPGCPMRF